MEQRQRLAYPVGRLLDERFGKLSGEQLDGQVDECPDDRTQDLLVGADALPTLPEGEDELWRPFRSLVNVRPPRPARLPKLRPLLALTKFHDFVSIVRKKPSFYS